MKALVVIAELSPHQRNQVLLALGIMMGLVVIGYIAALIFRRRLNAADETDHSSNVGFSLSDLRAMRDQGEITPEEYEATRAKVIAKVKSSVARASKDPPPPPPLIEPTEDPPN